MLVLLLPVAGATMVILAASWGQPWRRALMMGLVLWGCCVALITELLNAMAMLTSEAVGVAWAIVVATGALLLGARRIRGLSVFRHWRNGATEDRSTAAIQKPASASVPAELTAGRIPMICLIIIATLLVLTGVAAVVSPPNSWDVMDYHMPRVVQWIQHRSLSYHPVHYCPQLFYPPFAEWVILHLHLLFGSDRLSNLVQWAGFAGCIFAITYVAELIGVGRRGQWLAALLCATLPQAVLAASGAKNDLVATFWLLASVAFVLRFSREQRAVDAIFGGLALGLSLLTKGTSFFVAPAILAACLVPGLRRSKWRRWFLLACLPLFAVMLNLPQFARNLRFSGWPTGLSSPNGDGRQQLLVESPTPTSLAANALRHLSMHFATPSWSVNARATALARKVIAAMDVDPDDPRSTWHPYEISPPQHSEYFAGSPIHLVLLLAASLAIIRRRKEWPSGTVAFLVGVLGSLGMFMCLFPWNRWVARLHIAPLVLACALIPLVLERMTRTAVVISLVLILSVVSLEDTAFNATRPLVSRPGHPSIFRNARWNQYFVDVRHLQEPLTTFIEDIRRSDCRDVGFDASVRKGDTFEYPVLLGLGVAEGMTRVWSVGVTNISRTTSDPFAKRTACAVICRECSNHPEKLALYQATLPCVKTINEVVLFHQPRASSDGPVAGSCE